MEFMPWNPQPVIAITTHMPSAKRRPIPRHTGKGDLLSVVSADCLAALVVPRAAACRSGWAGLTEAVISAVRQGTGPVTGRRAGDLVRSARGPRPAAVRSQRAGRRRH